MICEKCGCDYARSRPTCPECGTPAPGYEKWTIDGQWTPPLPAEEEGLPPVLASWRTSVGWSIAGLLVGGYLVSLACMVPAALLAAALTAIFLGIGAPLAEASPLVLFLLCFGVLTGILEYAAMIVYAAVFYPSYFTDRPRLRSSAVISFANCAFGWLIFGLLWNANLTKRVKGVSAKVCTVLYALSLALMVIMAPIGLYVGNAHPQEFLWAWSQAYPEQVDPGLVQELPPGMHSDMSSAEREERFAEFWELMESQPDSFAYDYRETYTFERGLWIEEGVSSYTAACDDEGDVDLQHITYAAEDSYLAGMEHFFIGDKVIEVNGDSATDVTLEYEGDLVSLDKTALCLAGAVELSAETLSGLICADGGVTYHFAIAGPDQAPDGIGMVSDVESAQVSVHFNGVGELEWQTFEASGMTDDGSGEPFDATTSGTIDFGKWGETNVPEAPEPTAVLTSMDLASAQKAASASIAALSDNLTCVTESEVIVDGEAQATVHMELLRNGRDALLYVETDGNEDEAVSTFFQGDESMVFQGDQFVSRGNGGLPEDSIGAERALALVDLAAQAFVFDHGEGLTEYVLVVEGDDLPADMSFDGVGSVDYIGLHYWVNAEGSLEELYSEVIGTTPNAQGADPVVVSADAWYSDLGTTEIPPLP